MGMVSNPYLEKKISNKACVFGEMTDSQKNSHGCRVPPKRFDMKSSI
jgi:hypothetical protein